MHFWNASLESNPLRTKPIQDLLELCSASAQLYMYIQYLCCNSQIVLRLSSSHRICHWGFDFCQRPHGLVGWLVGPFCVSKEHQFQSVIGRGLNPLRSQPCISTVCIVSCCQRTVVHRISASTHKKKNCKIFIAIHSCYSKICIKNIVSKLSFAILLHASGLRDDVI